MSDKKPNIIGRAKYQASEVVRFPAEVAEIMGLKTSDNIIFELRDNNEVVIWRNGGRDAA